jgi:hypothetical protein
MIPIFPLADIFGALNTGIEIPLSPQSDSGKYLQ